MGGRDQTRRKYKAYQRGPPATELLNPFSPVHRINLLTHAPFSAGSVRGPQPFTRRLLMRFQNLRARWRESDLHSRNRVEESLRHCWSNHFWHKTTEQCAVVWLWGYTERSGASSLFNLTSKAAYTGICSCSLVSPIWCAWFVMGHLWILRNFSMVFIKLLRKFVNCSLVFSIVPLQGNLKFNPGCFGFKSSELCVLFSHFVEATLFLQSLNWNTSLPHELRLNIFKCLFMVYIPAYIL